MKAFLFDTSVLVAAHLEVHLHYDQAFSWMAAANQGKIRGLLSTHALAEMYTSFTNWPVPPPLTSDFVRRYIFENVTVNLNPIVLTPEDYKAAVNRVAVRKKRSGAIYDALHVQAALKSKCDGILTFNDRDFLPLAGTDIRILNPLTDSPPV